ncbi:MAG: phosphatidate cytidylyltransferase [Kiritimatiellia bacterium]|jgi:phosphatidate cytidylyltransferase
MLKMRVITGFTVVLIVAGILFLLPAWSHLFLLFAVFAIAQLEFSGMVQRKGHHYELTSTTLCGVAYLLFLAAESPVFKSCSHSFAPILRELDLSTIILCIAPAILLVRGVFRRKVASAMETFALSYAGFWYVAVLLGFMMRIAYEWETVPGATNYTGRLALLLFVAIVKAGDIGAYFIGTRFGRRRLIPEISPKKSVEGLWGGYLFGLVASLLVWLLAHVFDEGALGEMHYPLVHAILLPFILVSAGSLGDLAESLIKRSVDVKDSGGRFPGMGGILDILDSLLFAAPVAYVYFVAFLKN